jgi:hypothetical protein
VVVDEPEPVEAFGHVHNGRAFLAEGVGGIRIALVIQENRFLPIENRKECARFAISPRRVR